MLEKGDFKCHIAVKMKVGNALNVTLIIENTSVIQRLHDAIIAKSNFLGMEKKS